MADLNTRPNFADADGIYAELIKAYEALEPEEISAFSARLILLLSNHIGDNAVLTEAIRAAAGEKA